MNFPVIYSNGQKANLHIVVSVFMSFKTYQIRLEEKLLWNSVFRLQ